jgi:hypothetical protein
MIGKCRAQSTEKSLRRPLCPLLRRSRHKGAWCSVDIRLYILHNVIPLTDFSFSEAYGLLGISLYPRGGSPDPRYVLLVMKGAMSGDDQHPRACTECHAVREICETIAKVQAAIPMSILPDEHGRREKGSVVVIHRFSHTRMLLATKVKTDCCGRVYREKVGAQLVPTNDGR